MPLEKLVLVLMRLAPMSLGVQLLMGVVVLGAGVGVRVARDLVLWGWLIGPMPMGVGMYMPMFVPVRMRMRVAMHQVAVTMFVFVHVFMQMGVPMLVLMRVLAIDWVMRIVGMIVRQSFAVWHRSLRACERLIRHRPHPSDTRTCLGSTG